MPGPTPMDADTLPILAADAVPVAVAENAADTLPTLVVDEELFLILDADALPILGAFPLWPSAPPLPVCITPCLIIKRAVLMRISFAARTRIC